jgi:hypothetical protein
MAANSLGKPGARSRLDPSNKRVCVRFMRIQACAVDRTSGRPSVCPPWSVAPAHLPSPGNRQTPPSRREVTSHSVRRPLLHARHSVEYSHPWVRLSAALREPIVHSWVFAFSHPLLCAPLDSRSAVASIASRGSQLYNWKLAKK